jgi:hypothetical protein
MGYVRHDDAEARPTALGCADRAPRPLGDLTVVRVRRGRSRFRLSDPCVIDAYLRGHQLAEVRAAAGVTQAELARAAIGWSCEPPSQRQCRCEPWCSVGWTTDVFLSVNVAPPQRPLIWWPYRSSRDQPGRPTNVPSAIDPQVPCLRGIGELAAHGVVRRFCLARVRGANIRSRSR